MIYVIILKCFIVPPHQMLLYDKSGGDISGVFGPVEEGSALVLICEVRGGNVLNALMNTIYFMSYKYNTYMGSPENVIFI